MGQADAEGTGSFIRSVNKTALAINSGEGFFLSSSGNFSFDNPTQGSFIQMDTAGVEISSSKFHLKNDGDLVVKKVDADEGSIGGFNLSGGGFITSGQKRVIIASGQGAFGPERMAIGLNADTFTHTSGVGILASGSGYFRAGNPTGQKIEFDGANLIVSSSNFSIDSSGNTTMQGDITADSGRLGGSTGWIIEQGMISSNTIQIANGAQTQTKMFNYDGDDEYGGINFGPNPGQFDGANSTGSFWIQRSQRNVFRVGNATNFFKYDSGDGSFNVNGPITATSGQIGLFQNDGAMLFATAKDANSDNSVFIQLSPSINQQPGFGIVNGFGTTSSAAGMANPVGFYCDGRIASQGGVHVGIGRLDRGSGTTAAGNKSFNQGSTTGLHFNTVTANGDTDSVTTDFSTFGADYSDSNPHLHLQADFHETNGEQVKFSYGDSTSAMDYDGTGTDGIKFLGKLTLPPAGQRFTVIFGDDAPVDGQFLYASRYDVGGFEGFGIPMIRNCSVTGVSVMISSITGLASPEYIDIEIKKGTSQSTSSTDLVEFRLTSQSGGILAGSNSFTAITAQTTYAQGTYSLSAGNYLKVLYDESGTFTTVDVIVAVELTYD